MKERKSAGESDRQQRLHAEAAKHLGTIAGGDPTRSESVRQAVRRRLRQARNR